MFQLASANPILDRQPTNQHIRQILLQLEVSLRFLLTEKHDSIIRISNKEIHF